MVPVGYTWLRQTFGLLKSELEHESYLGSRASLTHQKNGRKTQKAAESRRRWFYRVFICEICGQKLRFLKSAYYGLLVSVSRIESAASRSPGTLAAPSSNRAGGFLAHGRPRP